MYESTKGRIGLLGGVADFRFADVEVGGLTFTRFVGVCLRNL